MKPDGCIIGCGCDCGCCDMFKSIKYRFNSFFISESLVLALGVVVEVAFAFAFAFAFALMALMLRNSLNNVSYFCWGRFTMSFILGTVSVSLKKEYKLCSTKMIMSDVTDT